MKTLLRLGLVVVAAGAPALATAAEFVTKTEDLGALFAPVTLNFGNSFNDQDVGASGIQVVTSAIPVTLQVADFFVDEYRFVLGAAVDATAIAGTLDLGGGLNIDALEMRLYSGSSLPSSMLGTASPLSALTPALLAVGNGDYQSLDGVSLAAGAYVMQIRGQLAGLTGGSYAGVVNLSPVPEPEGIALAIAGLLVLARLGRGQRSR